jgi:ribonucrease Y
MADGPVDLLRELEHADEEMAALLAALDELHAASEAVRERALELDAFFEHLPGERASAAADVEGARSRAAEARRAAERAYDEVRAAEADGAEERLAHARRFEVRARDALGIAERRRAEAEKAAAQLEARADAAEHESEKLLERARRLAAGLRERPRLAMEAGEAPDGGLAGLAEWGTQARAALLVGRSQLAGERDALIRQANELAAVVLGETLTPTSAAGAARRVERKLRAG